MSLSADLCLGTVDAIVDRLGLVEVPGDGTPERMQLTSPMSPDAPVGAMRLWRAAGVADLVYVGLTVQMIGLDSHMLFAFTPPESPVPHFTLDSVAGGPPPGADPDATPSFAFHLDLIPKVDLGAHLPYLRHCFEPLTALRSAAQETPGLTPAHLSPTQYAVMSAWMLVHRADESAFSSIRPHVDAYRDHWFSLVEGGVPESALAGLAPADFAERDRRNRSIVFDATVDPVWDRVTQLVGPEQSEAVRSTLAAPIV
ncbi:MAG: hypothetical protein ACKO04_07985 [Actinomycetes bacterium]